MGSLVSIDDGLVRRAIGASYISISIVDVREDTFPICYVNEAFEELTGFAQHDCLGENVGELLREDMTQPARKCVKSALKQGNPCQTIIQSHRKDGSVFLSDLRLTPIRDDDGEVTHFVGNRSAVPFPGLSLLRDEALARQESLTNREREMLEHLVRGQSTKEAARSLNISPRTAERHRQNIMHKMGLDSVAQLAIYAISADPTLPRVNRFSQQAVIEH